MLKTTLLAAFLMGKEGEDGKTSLDSGIYSSRTWKSANPTINQPK
ncbi:MULTISPECIES: hypothetical protein [Bacillaceae]|nr:MULTISPECIES: hypothetical protein [Bacillaceae]